eukprot:6480237-Amphidinium_carterae.1
MTLVSTVVQHKPAIALSWLKHHDVQHSNTSFTTVNSPPHHCSSRSTPGATHATERPHLTESLRKRQGDGNAMLLCRFAMQQCASSTSGLLRNPWHCMKSQTVATRRKHGQNRKCRNIAHFWNAFGW